MSIDGNSNSDSNALRSTIFSIVFMIASYLVASELLKPSKERVVRQYLAEYENSLPKNYVRGLDLIEVSEEPEFILMNFSVKEPATRQITIIVESIHQAMVSAYCTSEQLEPFKRYNLKFYYQYNVIETGNVFGNLVARESCSSANE